VTTYTEDHLDLLRAMSAAKLAASSMARGMSYAFGGEFTKNAIIGVCHRNHIPLSAPKNGRPEGARDRKPRRLRPKVRLQPQSLKAVELPIEPLRIPFLELRRGQCKNVVGTGGDAFAVYCGHETTGGPWCPSCHAINTMVRPRRAA
jgi:hypothetical protein